MVKVSEDWQNPREKVVVWRQTYPGGQTDVDPRQSEQSGGKQWKEEEEEEKKEDKKREVMSSSGGDE